MALVIAYLSLASIHECTNFSSNSSTSTLTISCPSQSCLVFLPLFLFRVREMQVCSYSRRKVRKMRECVPAR